MGDIYAGTTGDVTATGFNCDLESWSFEVSADNAEKRTFSSVWKKRKNTAYGGQGQFEGTIQFNQANSQPIPSSTGGGITTASFEGVSFTLTAETGCTLTFTGNIEGVNLRRVATDFMTGTFRMAADGEVSIGAWDET